MPLDPTVVYKNTNSPSKEIWASSGIYDQKNYGPQNDIYSPDTPNSVVPNTGINTTTSSTTPSPTAETLNPEFKFLSNGTFYIDDMLIFNKYIHYDGSSRTFDPQSFLQEALVTFNVYSLEYRT